jgi:hypothetical protein
MSIFNGAVNGFRSTVSRAGKFYNSANANKAKAVAGYMARSARINPMSMAPIAAATAIGVGGGAMVAGRDHHGRGAAAGGLAAGGGMAAYGAFNIWNKMSAGAGGFGGSAIRGLLR